MSTQHNATVRIVVLLACLAPWNGAVHAQSAANSKFSEELAIQDSIYRMQRQQLPPGYTVDRSLFSYVDTLPSGFGTALAALGPDDRWLDIGAGQGRAILDYYTPERDMSEAEEQAWRERRARAVGISIEDRRTPRWHLTAKSM